MNGLFIGLTTIDIQYLTEAFPKPNIKLKTAPPKVLVGGPATNAAVIFSHLGGNANLVSPVGESPFSAFINSDFKRYGVKHFDPKEGEKLDPVIASVITSTNNGDRNIFTNNPPNIIFSEYNIVEQIEQAEVVLVDGFYPDIAIEAVWTAKNQNIPIVMDGGSWKPQYNELLPIVDFAVCSNDFIPPNCKTTDDIFDYLFIKGAKNVVITRGANSILWSEGNGIQEFIVKQVNAIDTLGAGDFFHGAFAYSIANQNNLADSIAFAAQIASESCKYSGTREWLNFVK